MWATFFLDRDRLPKRRVLVRFDYPTVSGPGSRSWLLIEPGDAEICEKYPGGEEHLVVVVNDPVAFAYWHMGELAWSDALRAGAIELQGSGAWPEPSRHGTGITTTARSRSTASNRPRTTPCPPPFPPEVEDAWRVPVRSGEVQALHFSIDGTEITIDLS